MINHMYAPDCCLYHHHRWRRILRVLKKIAKKEIDGVGTLYKRNLAKRLLESLEE